MNKTSWYMVDARFQYGGKTRKARFPVEAKSETMARLKAEAIIAFEWSEAMKIDKITKMFFRTGEEK